MSSETQPHEQKEASQSEDLVQDIAENAQPEAERQFTRSSDRSASGAPAVGQAVRDIFSTDEIFQRILTAAAEEFRRSRRTLFFSGLAAGLSIGLSFLARAAMIGELPEDGSAFVGNLLYPIGFIFIVMGGYQLYTENTLSPVTLVLTRIASLPALLRLWGIVLLANLVGAIVVGFVLSETNVLTPEARTAAFDIGSHALEVAWGDLFVKGVFAGWLVAGMVWIIYSVTDAITRFLSVYLIMYLIPTADLFHCIVGACEGMFMVFAGEVGLFEMFGTFFLPVVLGNTLGGVLLVAILNYGQTKDTLVPDGEGKGLRLNWRQWLVEYHTGEQLEKANS